VADESLPERPSGVRASDDDRHATVAHLQRALGEGRLDPDEFAQRADAATEAVTTAELAALVADLPAEHVATPEIVGARAAQAPVSTVFGDVKLSGRMTVPPQLKTVFGDVQLDLRELRTDADRVELTLSTVFGDVEVIVAEGVDAELHGWTLFGDRKVELAPVPRLAGTPLVVVHARSFFGDLRVRSLAPGQSPSRWRALLDRLAQWPPPPPAPPAPPVPPLPPAPPAAPVPPPPPLP
jgi:hypothetical protein